MKKLENQDRLGSTGLLPFEVYICQNTGRAQPPVLLCFRNYEPFMVRRCDFF